MEIETLCKSNVVNNNVAYIMSHFVRLFPIL